MSFPNPYYRWRPHPWHGLSVGDNPPKEVNAFIEITPFDSMKYEVDKETGYLRVDRPQFTSSLPPVLYGFIPRTYCGSRVAALADGHDRSDGDPLDICVISELPFNRAEVILPTRVIGGLKMIDRGEVDDKIIAVVRNDAFWKDVNDIDDVPEAITQRIVHYFNTYKMTPGKKSQTFIEGIYGRKQAMDVIEAAVADYAEAFGS